MALLFEAYTGFPGFRVAGLVALGLRLLGFEVCAVCGFAVLGFCV